jgi:hypothetical protein
MLIQRKKLSGAVEHRRCLMRPFAERAGNIPPRMKQVRSSCHTPWMQNEEAFMSRAGRTEYSHGTATPDIRDGGHDALAAPAGVYRSGHENEFFPIVRMVEPPGPGIAESPSARRHAGGLKLLLPKVDYWKEIEIRETPPVSPSEVSNQTVFS